MKDILLALSVWIIGILFVLALWAGIIYLLVLFLRFLEVIK